jgi:GTP-binding protein HflX
MGSSNSNGSPEKAVLVGLILPDLTRDLVDEHLEELAKLTESAGGTVVGKILQERRSPDSATFIGRGKVATLAEMVRDRGASLVVFDDDLTPAQARNVEKEVSATVIDRSALILDIFARRARSAESRTQVELAQLNYLLPRLTRQWSHLSRQAGGIGTRGVGETQLELDRRITRDRIARLKIDLERIEQTRHTQRRGRSNLFTIALVGYTNAGKSTLFNQLTRGGAEAVDKLFATLDAKLQRSHYPMPTETVYIDTVGFIRKLPHHLVASFRSTMEEAVAADLVLHVINLAHPNVEAQREVGRAVLADLLIPEDRVIEVYNKADQIAPDVLFDRDMTKSVTVSALTGSGIEKLVELLRRRERAGGKILHLEIPASDGKAAAQLHELGEVYETKPNGGVTHYVAWVPLDHVHVFEQFLAEASRSEEPMRPYTPAA